MPQYVRALFKGENVIIKELIESKLFTLSRLNFLSRMLEQNPI